MLSFAPQIVENILNETISRNSIKEPTDKKILVNFSPFSIHFIMDDNSGDT